MAALSGQITIETAGTAVQGPSTPTARWFYVGGHPDNTGVVYVGNDGNGDVTSANGYGLNPGQGMPLDLLEIADGNLSGLWFDAATSGDVVQWHIGSGLFG